MTKEEIKKKIAIPLAIILAGVILTGIMIIARKPPAKETRENPGRLVEVLEVNKSRHRVNVFGTGTVQPRQEASIAPQVSGKAVRVADNFIAGGFFRAGELLFEIESVDYQLALEGAQAEQARAEYNLATVESQARVARHEWEHISNGNDEKPNPLVVYEPQLKNARATMEAAEAGVKKARLDVERTRVRAPFNCRVRSEQVDLGQYLRAGTNVAMLLGTDEAEVAVPLSLSDLRWLIIPRPGEDSEGSYAELKVVVDGMDYTWRGRVVRTLGVLDQQGRMERVVVSVEDPFGLNSPGKKRLFDLAVGTFVEVGIEGKTLEDIYLVPLNALRENSTVWLYRDDNTLKIQPVEVLRREQDNALISKGLADSDLVILTYLTGVADGLKLRPAESGGER
jgi:RND family efflux transporter MFP subunit